MQTWPERGWSRVPGNLVHQVIQASPSRLPQGSSHLVKARRPPADLAKLVVHVETHMFRHNPGGLIARQFLFRRETVQGVVLQ